MGKRSRRQEIRTAGEQQDAQRVIVDGEAGRLNGALDTERKP